MTSERPVRISEADPVKVHAELAREHGPYNRFDEMMEKYYARIRELNITGAINVIITYREDMHQTNQTQYLPVIHAMNQRAMDWALEFARSGGGAK